jgi:hypothetical protein
MSSYPDESTSEHEDELPFALSVDPTLQPNARDVQDCRHLQVLVRSALTSSTSQTTQPPDLESSLLSNPTDGESQASAASGGDSFMAGNASFFKNSQLIDAAASMFHPASSLLNISLAGSHDFRATTDPNFSLTFQNPAAAPANGAPNSSFSTLLLAADDRHADAGRYAHHHGDSSSVSRSRLSALQEEQGQSTASASASTSYIKASRTPRSLDESVDLMYSSENYPRQDRSFPSHHQSRDHPGSQTIVPAAHAASSHSMGSPRMFRTEERRLATLAGATATRTGAASFRVSLDLSPSCSSVRDVMDVVGNPDLLVLWCDPVTDLVVTRSSEGARDHSLSGRNPTIVTGPNSLHSHHASQSDATSSSAASGREYEGEWTEATTSRLMSPPNTSCVYSTSRAVSAALGFPSFGKLVMFVERSRGQVSLTVGPFPGRIEILYKIRVDSVAGGRIRIAFDVALRPAASSDSYERVCMCGIWDWVEKCLLPSTDDYMDQTLRSAAMLRFLVENGEGRTMADESFPSGHPDFNGVSTEPLLSA